MMLHCAYYDLLYILGPLLLAFLVYRIKGYRYPVYSFPLTQTLIANGLARSTTYKKIISGLRFLTLCSLIFLILRPQWVDERSKVDVEGVSIIVAIDVSASMTFFDDVHDQKPRIDIAKKEAIHFIEKRLNDPIGIVLFGKEAIYRCPLTLDKHILKDIVGSVEIGLINADGTWLGTGLATAVNGLRTSPSKNKVIILLTDGQPTPPEKIEPPLAISVAKKFGIKVYTIGIGSEQGAFTRHPFLGIVPVPQEGLNVPLLKQIAEQTGGKFFRAKNQAEMRTVYDTIDRLEKTKMQTNIFHRYYEAFAYFVWFMLLLFGLELFLRFFIWRGVL
jgi:Ca-activated chloride channel homolog